MYIKKTLSPLPLAEVVMTKLTENFTLNSLKPAIVLNMIFFIPGSEPSFGSYETC